MVIDVNEGSGRFGAQRGSVISDYDVGGRATLTAWHFNLSHGLDFRGFLGEADS